MNDETLWSQLVSKLKEVAHVATIIKFDDIVSLALFPSPQAIADLALARLCRCSH